MAVIGPIPRDEWVTLIALRRSRQWYLENWDKKDYSGAFNLEKRVYDHMFKEIMKRVA